MFTRLGFENACCIARQASQGQQAFSKPCLVNLISKDTHLAFSVYWLQKNHLDIGPDKQFLVFECGYLLIHQIKHVFWELKRNDSFEHPKYMSLIRVLLSTHNICLG